MNGSLHRSGVSARGAGGRSCGSRMISFPRSCRMGLQRGCPVSHSHQHRMSDPVLLVPCQHLLLSVSVCNGVSSWFSFAFPEQIKILNIFPYAYGSLLHSLVRCLHVFAYFLIELFFLLLSFEFYMFLMLDLCWICSLQIQSLIPYFVFARYSQNKVFRAQLTIFFLSCLILDKKPRAAIFFYGSFFWCQD